MFQRNQVEFISFISLNPSFSLLKHFHYRNFVILVGHWLLHAFGILAITQMKDPGFSLPFLSLAPRPALFYCLSARFSDPNHFNSDLSWWGIKKKCLLNLSHSLRLKTIKFSRASRQTTLVFWPQLWKAMSS